MKKIIIILLLLAASSLAYGQQPAGVNAPAEEESSLNEYSVYQSDALWTNQRNEIFQLRELRGKPAIVTMFYGNCLQVCPILIRDANRVFQLSTSHFRIRYKYWLSHLTRKMTPRRLFVHMPKNMN